MLVLALLVLRLGHFGAGIPFAVATLTTGFVSVVGTVLMTAAPFSVAPSIHRMGIPLYFFGVVALQTLVGVREWRLAALPRVLAATSLLVAGAFLVFATLVTLYQQGEVERNTPVVWQWLAFLSSIVWLAVHGVVLGRPAIVSGSQTAGLSPPVEGGARRSPSRR